MLERIKQQALQGIGATVEDAMVLNGRYTTDELCDAADEVRRVRVGNVMDTCSIVNARSGRCSEDCKWCAQSGHFSTGVNEYEMIDPRDLHYAADENCRRGVMRFSMVTSGRRVAGAALRRFCDQYREIASRHDVYLCASMGLLDREQLQMLKDAGVKRYHCNLEASSDYFPQLCSTHTHADKLATIRAAREVGMEVCCGGIIGMGETMEQRLRLAQEARDAGAASIPVNILNPIPGTPLADTPLISEDEVARTVALMRLIAPDVTLRFAGGRMRLSAEATQRVLRGGMNGALVGDMLTTVGNVIDQDVEAFAQAGYESGLV